MATRRYKLNANENHGSVVEEVGAATNSKAIELTVDLDATLVNSANPAGGAITRGVGKEEVLRALDIFKDHILKGNWPPA
jgi:hypothetical protein